MSPMINTRKIAYLKLLRVFDFQITHPEQPWKRKVYSTSVIEDFELQVWENPLD